VSAIPTTCGLQAVVRVAHGAVVDQVYRQQALEKLRCVCGMLRAAAATALTIATITATAVATGNLQAVVRMAHDAMGDQVYRQQAREELRRVCKLLWHASLTASAACALTVPVGTALRVVG